MLRKYIGNAAFYRHVIAVALPAVLTNLVTTFVNLLDNMMVSSVGTEALVGVSIVNQFMSAFHFAIFGAVSAAGIFTAQYYGKRDEKGIVYTVRFKLMINLFCLAIGLTVFGFFGDALIASFLHEGESTGDLALAMRYAKQYLAVTMIGLLPLSLSQAYASSMRETGELRVPMYASFLAVAVNFVGNAILIFGLFGLPAMGAVGAAVATVIARFLEFFVLFVYAHRRADRCPWARQIFCRPTLPRALFFTILKKAIPLMLSEFFWSLSLTICNQCYSTRGLESVAAQTIVSTVMSLMSAVYAGVGVSICIVVGKQLGAGEIESAVDSARKMRTLAVMIGVAAGGTMAACSSVIPVLFSETGRVASLATYMLIVAGISTPFGAYSQSAYFTLRTGGKVIHTFLFDSVWMWAAVVPTALILAYLTGVSIEVLYAVCVLSEILKCLLGVLLVRYVRWANHLVGEEQTESGAEAPLGA